MSDAVITVACGLLTNEDGYALMGRRLSTGKCPTLWEYPGGKVEPGETVEQAVVREWSEELGLAIVAKERVSIAHYEWESPIRLVLLAVELVDAAAVIESGNSHDMIAWYAPNYSLNWVPMTPSCYMFYQDILKYLRSK